MNVHEAVALLHNEWRRGNKTENWGPMPYSPAQLGQAIDVVCNYIESLSIKDDDVSHRKTMLVRNVLRADESHPAGRCGMISYETTNMNLFSIIISFFGCRIGNQTLNYGSPNNGCSQKDERKENR